MSIGIKIVKIEKITSFVPSFIVFPVCRKKPHYTKSKRQLFLL